MLIVLRNKTKILASTDVYSVDFQRVSQFIGCRTVRRSSAIAAGFYQRQYASPHFRELMMAGIAAVFSGAVDNDFEQPWPVVNNFGQFLQADLRAGFLQQRVGIRGRSVLAFERHAMRSADKQFGLCKAALGQSFLDSAL